MPYLDKTKQRECQRKWTQKRRQDWLDANGPCLRCGSAENLEVDHIDRTQKTDHKVWSWAKDRREDELAKCQVLCRACHLAKSRECGDQPPASPHGSNRRYSTLGCRCDVCRIGHAKHNREWRARRDARMAAGPTRTEALNEMALACATQEE